MYKSARVNVCEHMCPCETPNEREGVGGEGPHSICTQIRINMSTKCGALETTFAGYRMVPGKGKTVVS